jgi:hypothetical protein
VIDIPLLKLLEKNERIHPTQQDLVNKLLKKVKNGKLPVRYVQKVLCHDKKVGRFYPKDDLSMTPLGRKIKHTMFKYLGHIDIDMKVGHPSIAVSVADMCMLELPKIKEYISNRDGIVREVARYYTVEGEEELTKDDVKLLFNSFIYGGGFSTWKREMAEGTEQRAPKKIADKPLQSFVKGFLDNRNTLMDFVFQKNTALFEGIKQQ